MGKIQQQVGKSWEQELMLRYNQKGWMSFKIPTMFAGTVFDIIFIKNNQCLCVEAKHIQGSKLYYKGSGLYKKRDELDNFIKKYNTNIYIFVKSDTDGEYWSSWLKLKPIFEEKGYITIDDCIKIKRK